MSGLWTPGGEHHVPAGNGGGRDSGSGPDDDDDVDGELDLDQEELDALAEAGISRQEAEAMARRMAEVRRELASVPAAQVVANHAMGLFELGAIHLNQETPDLLQAVLAIDAMAALVEGLGPRLGEAEGTLRDALAQIRLAFVEIRSREDP